MNLSKRTVKFLEIFTDIVIVVGFAFLAEKIKYDSGLPVLFIAGAFAIKRWMSRATSGANQSIDSPNAKLSVFLIPGILALLLLAGAAHEKAEDAYGAAEEANDRAASADSRIRDIEWRLRM